MEEINKKSDNLLCDEILEEYSKKKYILYKKYMDHKDNFKFIFADNINISDYCTKKNI